MKRALMVQPSIMPPGGGNSVAIRMMEAIKHDHRLTLLCWVRPDLEIANRYYGTALKDSEVEVLMVPSVARTLANFAPTEFAMIKDNYLARYARGIVDQFDVVMTANGEADLGPPAIQYIHYPKMSPERPEHDLRWYHSLGAGRAYRHFAGIFTGSSIDRVRRNLSVVNSEFIATMLRRTNGLSSVTLYPPVVTDFPEIPREFREDAFVCIGRINPQKRIDYMIDILKDVRAEGFPVQFHIVGSQDHASYTQHLRERVRADPSWLYLHEDVSRAEVSQLIPRYRYGIHAMVEEHFGIAVGEMMAAGCVVFAPNNGGPVEILGGDDRLLYDSRDDAVRKITAILRDRAYEDSVRSSLDKRRNLFSAESFTRRFRDLVLRFEAEHPRSARPRLAAD